MLEQRRLDYLQAMGVVQWLPRQPLPHAPAPRWLPETAARTPHKTPSFTHDGGHIAHPAANELLHGAGRPALTAMLDTTPAPAPAPAVAPPVREPEAAAAVTEAVTEAMPSATAEADRQVPEFRLFFVRNSLPLVWVCDQEQDLEALQQLAFAVQKALTGQPLFLPQPQEFRWPFIASAQEDQSVPVALQALRAQWQYLTSQGVQAAVTFGASSEYWLQRAGAPRHFHAPLLATFTQDAAQKRALWLSLCDLNGA